MTMTAPNQKNASNNYSDLMLLVYDYNNHTQKFYDCIQGQIHDSKLGGGVHLKKLRRAEGGAKIFGVFRVKNHDFTPKNLNFFQF
jgi:hypothetical protein